jgi:hypothetical protein
MGADEDTPSYIERTPEGKIRVQATKHIQGNPDEGMRGMSENLVKEMLSSSRERPKILLHDKHVLESSTEDETEDIHELSGGGKVVIRQFVRTEVTQHIIVREYDPESSYADAINEFVNEED